MIGNFQACVDFSLREEGGFCNTPGDSGGATNHGVTIGELSAVLGRPATIEDVKNLTAEQAEAIYKPRYWDAVNGDNLPAGLDLVVFDFGINAGPGTSAKRLQALIGAVVDGDIGPKTLAILPGRDFSALINSVTDSHQVYYRQLSGFPQFGAAWLGRTRRCQLRALAMQQASN